MKKISLLFTMLLTVLMVSLVITSCSSDEEDDESDNNSSGNPSSLIIGSWDLCHEEFFKNGQLIKIDRNYGGTYVFKKDKTMIRVYGSSISAEGTYNYNAENNYLFARYKSYGSWENSAGEVFTLTEDSLVWKTPYDDDEYDYTISYMTRTKTEYDDPFEETIVDVYSGKEKEIIDNFSTIRPFIGKWYVNSKYYIFNSDKTFIYTKDNVKRFWDYNPTSRIFGMTNFDVSWTVTVISPYEWSNMNNSTNKAFSLSRVSGFIDSDKKLLVGEWKKTDGTDAVIYFDSNFNYKYIYNGYSKIVSGAGKLNDLLKSNEIQIASLAGSVIEIKVPNDGNKKLSGNYIFQSK